MKIQGNTVGTPIKPEKVVEKAGGGNCNVNITTIEVNDPLSDFPELDYGNFRTLIASGILPALRIDIDSTHHEIGYLSDWTTGYADAPVIFESVSYKVTVTRNETICEAIPQIGDISTALDSIIALQERLIGGDGQ